MGVVTESTVEAVTLGWLGDSGWTVRQGGDVAPDTGNAERDDYGDVVLAERFRSALARLKPDLPSDALDDAQRRLVRPAGTTLETRNRDFHRMVVDGVSVEYVDGGDTVRGGQVRRGSTSTWRRRTAVRPAPRPGRSSARSARVERRAGRRHGSSPSGTVPSGAGR